MTELSNQKADERKIIRIIIITRSEPVGEPYREVCLSPWKRKLKNVIKPNWPAKCLVIREKLLSWKGTQWEWKHDIVYDPKRSQGHKRSPWPTLWPQMSRWPLWLVWPSLWFLKVKGSLEVAVTYFMTSKGHGDLCGRFDLVYDLKRSGGH